MTHLYTEIHLLLHMHTCARAKACSHGAILSECDWVVWMSMRLFIWCDCNIITVSQSYLCVQRHTWNGFQMHSVRLGCAIPICIYTDRSRTV